MCNSCICAHSLADIKGHIQPHTQDTCRHTRGPPLSFCLPRLNYDLSEMLIGWREHVSCCVSVCMWTDAKLFISFGQTRRQLGGSEAYQFQTCIFTDQPCDILEHYCYFNNVASVRTLVFLHLHANVIYLFDCERSSVCTISWNYESLCYRYLRMGPVYPYWSWSYSHMVHMLLCSTVGQNGQTKYWFLQERGIILYIIGCNLHFHH